MTTLLVVDHVLMRVAVGREARWGGEEVFERANVDCQVMLRSKGLKDATCVGWFGDDWDCSVGSPPEANGSHE